MTVAELLGGIGAGAVWFAALLVLLHRSAEPRRPRTGGRTPRRLAARG